MNLKKFLLLFIITLSLFVGPRVFAADNFTGDVSYYVQQGTTTSIQSGYQSNMSGMNIAFPTQNYFTLNKRNLYYYFIKEIDVANSTYSFQANHTYNIKLKFTFGSYIQRAISINNGISPSYGPVTYCGNGTCTKTSSCSASPDNTCTWTIIYNSNSAHTGLTLSFGSIYDVDKYIFWNNSSDYDQGIRLDLASIEDTTQSVDLSPIIDSQNQNTQDIINNNNTNTQNIINNQNENTEKEIESQKVCKDINYVINFNNKNDFDEGFIDFSNNNNITGSTGWRVSQYIPVSATSSYNLVLSGSGLISSNASYCLYDSNMSILSCTKYTGVSSYSITPTSDGYVRFSAYVGHDGYSSKLSGRTCISGNQALSDDINDLNNTLNNSDTSDVEANADANFGDVDIDDRGLQSLLNTIVQFVSDIFSSECSPLEFPLPFVEDEVQLQCMSNIYTTHFPTFFQLYQLITTGLIAYRVILNLFHKIHQLEDPNYDKVEVLNL